MQLPCKDEADDSTKKNISCPGKEGDMFFIFLTVSFNHQVWGV